MLLRPSLSRVRLPLLPLSLAALVVVGGAVPASAPAAAPGQRLVGYGGVTISVPAAWPVYDLRSDPHRCVRFDVHAVYLGRPGPDQQCPAHLVGRTEAVLVGPDTPGEGADAAAASDSQVTRTFRGAGVRVTATYGARSDVAREVAGSARAEHAAAPTPAMSPAARVTAAPTLPSDAQSASSVFIGNAFDTCAAPSLDVMGSWITTSPYRGMNIYIGGAARACGDGNLSASWVSSVRAMGWRLIPTYVGLQAPCTSYNQRMAADPATATTQGAQAADDAVAREQAFGIGTSTPVYLDVENYDTTVPGCSSAVLAFVAGWTQQLHNHGYVSGAYGSGGSLVRDLAAQWGTGYQEPDELWIGDWNGLDSVFGNGYVPDSMWTDHQRVHQWQGGHQESYGGYTVNIDTDAVDGAVAGPPGGRCFAYPAETYGPDGCAGGFSLQGQLQYWRLGAPNGLVGAMRWTHGNGATESEGATWAPTLRPGAYDVAVWVPPTYADATLTYTVTDPSGTRAVTVDQAAHKGAWVSLGRYAANPQTGISVHTGDATATTSTVGVDAMRFHYIPDYRYAIAADFNGDRRADAAVFRPATGVWYVRGLGHFQFGHPGDVPIAADFNGDGRADAAVFRPATGVWYVRGLGHFQLGHAGDVPIAADFNGDGRAEAAVWRPSVGTWWIRGVGRVHFGEEGDIPAAADFNGDGRADVAVFRSSVGRWWVRGVGSYRWGMLGDVPVVGDFNHDGRSEVTVFRASAGRWWIRGSRSVGWGASGDLPV